MGKRDGREIKRISIRYNLEQEKDRKVWDILHSLDTVDYISRQEFMNNAIIHYRKWLEAKEAAALPEGMETKFKRWMKEVLFESGVNITTERQEASDIKSTKVIDEKEEAFDKSLDFLSPL